MSKIPFKRFVIANLLYNKKAKEISEQLAQFGYNITALEVADIFDELCLILPTEIAEHLKGGQIFDLTNEEHVKWLNDLHVYKFYDYLLNHKIIKSSTTVKPYFKWCASALWINANTDIASLVNIFLYNEEEYTSIANMVSFRCKKIISVDDLKIYHHYFWDTEDLTAKDAIHYFKPFWNNALIVRRIRSGISELEMPDDSASHDGSDIPITFHDINYIKWKIGYKEFTVPNPIDFMKKIQDDSYFKYYETMNMTQSIEIEEEGGVSEKLGVFDTTRKRKRNVEEMRAKMAKHWLEMYLKAQQQSSEQDSSRDQVFFERLEHLELGYGDYADEKIMSIDEHKAILAEITKDMNPDL